jgi:hypothetical protein
MVRTGRSELPLGPGAKKMLQQEAGYMGAVRHLNAIKKSACNYKRVHIWVELAKPITPMLAYKNRGHRPPKYRKNAPHFE